MINHETKEIILEADYDELDNIGAHELQWVLYTLCACVAMFCVWLVDFA